MENVPPRFSVPCSVNCSPRLCDGCPCCLRPMPARLLNVFHNFKPILRRRTTIYFAPIARKFLNQRLSLQRDYEKTIRNYDGCLLFWREVPLNDGSNITATTQQSRIYLGSRKTSRLSGNVLQTSTAITERSR